MGTKEYFMYVWVLINNFYLQQFIKKKLQTKALDLPASFFHVVYQARHYILFITKYLQWAFHWTVLEFWKWLLKFRSSVFTPNWLFNLNFYIVSKSLKAESSPKFSTTQELKRNKKVANIPLRYKSYNY